MFFITWGVGGRGLGKILPNCQIIQLFLGEGRKFFLDLAHFPSFVLLVLGGGWHAILSHKLHLHQF